VREIINQGVTIGTARIIARSFDRGTEFMIYSCNIDIYMSTVA